MLSSSVTYVRDQKFTVTKDLFILVIGAIDCCDYGSQRRKFFIAEFR
jgi:hypothetical protein